MRTLALVALVACGPPPPIAGPSYLDLADDDDQQRLAIAGIMLPRMPVDVAPDDPELEEGWARASRALSMATPRPPAGDAIEVETWAEEELTEWITSRGRAIGEAQRALEAARVGPSPDHSVVASAILGLAYSRFALDLRGIPAPELYADDVDRAIAFRDALRRAAAPLWQRALDAFGGCSRVAGDQPAHSLDHWREFCDGEIRTASSMLPGAEDDDEDEDDEKTAR
jgi:hypothetical protein